MLKTLEDRGDIKLLGGFGADDFVGDLPNGGDANNLPVPSQTLALWVILTTVTMLFAGFTSAYLVRRTAPDWVPISAPTILQFNTAVLLLSSIVLELAKHFSHEQQLRRYRLLLVASVVLGSGFVTGQILAWKELSATGIFLPSSPHVSFFYMLTSVHAAHVLGGIAWLSYAMKTNWNGPKAAVNSLSLSTTYWHFVAGVWVFLYLLLFVWK